MKELTGYTLSDSTGTYGAAYLGIEKNVSQDG